MKYYHGSFWTYRNTQPSTFSHYTEKHIIELLKSKQVVEIHCVEQHFWERGLQGEILNEVNSWP